MMQDSNIICYYRIFLILVGFVLASAQMVASSDTSSWARLLEEADKASVQGHQTPKLVRLAQDSAIVLATQALKSVPAGDVDGIPSILNRLGGYHFLIGNYNVADSLWRVAAESQDNIGGFSLQKEQSLLCLAICQRFRADSLDNSEVYNASKALMDSITIAKDSSAVRRSWLLADLCGRLGLYADLDRFAMNAWGAYLSNGGDAYFAMRALIHDAERVSKKARSNTPNSWIYQDSAISFARLALTTVEQVYGSLDTNVAFVLQRLGDYQMRRGDRLGAASSWERAWGINKTQLRQENIEYQGSVDRMSSIYRSRGQFLQAEQMARLALELRKKTQGPGHPETAAMYSNLGSLYQLTGKFSEAERCYLEALSIRQKALERLPEDIAYCYSRLAGLAADRGRYSHAEKNFQQAYSVCRGALGEQHLYTLDIRQQMAQLHLQWGDIGIAVEILTDVLDRRTKFLGDDHPALLNGTLELARLNAELHRYAHANSLIQKAELIAEKSIEKNSWAYASFLESKGFAQLTIGKGAEAEQTLSQCLILKETFLTASDGRFLPILIKLGKAHETTGKLTSAAAVYERAETIVRRSDLPWVAGAADAMDQLAIYALKQTESKKAFELALMAFTRRIKVFRDGARILSEREAVRFQQSVRRSRDVMLSAFLGLHTPDTMQLTAVADAIIATKGWVTEELFWRERSLAISTDAASHALLDSLQDDRTRLAGMYLRVVDSSDNKALIDTLTVLTNRISRREQRLARTSAAYSSGRKTSEAVCASVQSAIPAGATLVEYVRYIDWRQLDSAEAYAVLILTNDRSVLADIASAKRVDSAISAYRFHLDKVIESSRLPSVQDVTDYHTVAAAVSDLLWSGVSGGVLDSALIFVAPDAQIHTVSFAGLPDKQGYLIESHPVHYVRTGRDILQDVPTANTGLVVLGDPDFDMVLPETVLVVPSGGDQPDNADPLSGVLNNCSSLRIRNLARLPGTHDEVEKVAKLWGQIPNETVKLLVGSEASEVNLRNYAASSRVLHLASHAYQINDSCGDVTTRLILSNNRSLLSGLFLAGASRRSVDTRTDGILTATEITTLDLHRVKTVILSACQTALGSIDAEGVTGLMRSFQTAGARTVIGSLWPVGDNAAGAFVQALYSQPNSPLPAVMRNSANSQLRRLRQRGQPDHPVLWAPFIATGDWRSLR